MKINSLLSRIAVLGIGLLLLAAAACQERTAPAATQPAPASPQTDAAVTGSVTYGDGAALPAGATLTVVLEDVSRADASAVLMARQVIPEPGPPPVSFRLDYRQSDIDPRNTYSVSARVESAEGKLLFTNDTVYMVLTLGNSDRVDLELVAVP